MLYSLYSIPNGPMTNAENQSAHLQKITPSALHRA
jgi:hypothetical protein